MCSTYLHTQPANNLASAYTPNCRGVLIQIPDPEPVYIEQAPLAVTNSLQEGMLRSLHQLVCSL